MATAKRVWEASIGTVELFEYADGDITIQERDSNDSESLRARFNSTGFVLSPTQADRLVTVGRLLVNAQTPDTWKLGENCVGDRLLLAYDPAACPAYKLGDGDEFLALDDATLIDLIDAVTLRINT
jgi:hypothetical protein